MEIQQIRRANLQQLADASSISEIARRAKRSSSQIGDVLAERKSFGEKFARSLERSLGLDEGSLDIDHSGGVALMLSGDLIKIPVLAWNSVASQNFVAEGSIISEKSRKDAFALRIFDRSMAPALLPGDVAIFERNAEVAPGCYALAQIDQTVVLRRYRQTGLSTFELVPENSDFPTIKSTDGEIRLLAVMVEARKYF